MERKKSLNWIVIATANVLLWPLTHFLVSWWALRLEATSFHEKSFPFREFAFEQGGAFYEKVFLIKKWKRRLPDGAAMLGVKIDKSTKTLATLTGRQKYFQETMRSEWAHWVTMLLGLVLSSFNTFEVWLIMLAYALIANAPCIMAQRYNRIKLKRLL